MSAEGRLRVAVCVVPGFLVALQGSTASADPVDPSYGRVEGDVTVAPGIGLGAEPRGPSLVGDLRIRYLQTAGVFAMYQDGSALSSSAEPRRSLSFGTELRPVFLARYLQDLESRHAWMDLIMDSLSLDLGVVFAQPAGESFGGQPGLQAGVGFGVPVLLRVDGPWIGVHGGVRWSEDALATGHARKVSDQAPYLAITIVYEQLFMTHIVDAGDRRPE